MKKGIVKYFDSKNGYGFIQYDESKEIYVHRTGIMDKTLKNLEEGQEVLFEIKSGRKGPEAYKVKLLSKEIKEKRKTSELDKKEDQDLHLEEAYSPYNFVPLNDKVVEIEKPANFNKYDMEKKTGYIELKITTHTPLYIRDSLTKSDMEKDEEIKNNNRKNNTKHKFIKSSFFSPGGRICIPGSSLRGMLRTMVEITSFSRFSFFEKNRKYHFRSFADKSIDFRNEYKFKMLGTDKKSNYSKELRAGYLIKEGLNYKIKPAKRISNHQFFRVEEDLVISKKILKDKMSVEPRKGTFDENKDYNMGFKKIKFLLNKSKKNQLKLTDIYKENDPVQGAIEGTLVCSGWMRGSKKNPRGKKMHWVIGPAEDIKLDFAEGVIDDYKNDDARNAQADLLIHLKKNSRLEVPCFYIEKNGKVISFGHTGFFRLSYEQKLNDLIPKPRKNFSGVDIAEAIFGNETDFPSRVFFEDANLDDNQTDVLTEETIIKILSKPKPTTFQHYLRQDREINEPLFKNYEGIKNYNSRNAQLRGNKLYWHKSDSQENWEETIISFSVRDFDNLLENEELSRDDFGKSLSFEKNKAIVDLKKLPSKIKPAILNAVGLYETQHTKIKAVKSGKSFIGRIRFENLSDVELGAILFALDLPGKCYHKLGMGKPLGLGSIEISPELFLSDRTNRYVNLFSEWEVQIEQSQKKQIEDLKSKFAKYILETVDPSISHGDCFKNLWDMDRMRQLKIILDYKNKPRDEQTRYMEDPKDFAKRNVLPTPSEII